MTLLLGLMQSHGAAGSTGQARKTTPVRFNVESSPTPARRPGRPNEPIRKDA